MFIELPSVEKEGVVRRRIKVSRVEAVGYSKYKYSGDHHHSLNIVMKSGREYIADFGTNGEEAVKLFVKLTEDYD